MRQEKRIPIIINYFKDNPSVLSEFTDEQLTRLDKKVWKEVEEYWKESHDQRFGQLLVNMSKLYHFSSCYHQEEDDWLIDKGYINVEDIKFWGQNYTKDMVKLDKTNWVLLRDLTTDHIKGLIKFFVEQGKTINPKYLEYFESRVKTSLEV